MRWLSPMVFASILLVGCATQPAEPDVKPLVSTTGAETDQQMRARVHTELAAGYYGLGNLGVALEEVNVAKSADPAYGPAYNVAGLVYAELKEERLAQQNFEAALRINPLDADANINYGMYLCGRNRGADGLKYILASLRNPLYRTPERSYLNAGLCSRQSDDNKAAVEYFQRALKLRPNQPQVLYQLADLEFQHGNLAEAKAYLDRFSKISPPGAEVLWLGVRVERKLGNRNAEASYALQLQKNYPDSKETRALSAGQFE